MNKLSCLLVTKDRLAQAKKAIQCFENQTLSDSELVIVDESEDGLADYVQSLNNPRLRFIDPGNKELTLGELRNLSVQEARGDVVVQWDDDDWYHPDRLKRQWNAMQYTGAVACFLQRWTLAWPERDIFALSKRRCWEGSIMIQREYIPKYTPRAYGEDSDMVRNLLCKNLPLALLDAPELYVYIVHGNNTYPESHFVHNIFNETWAESQRDSATQPRVAFPALPWVMRPNFHNSVELRHLKNVIISVQLCSSGDVFKLKCKRPQLLQSWFWFYL